MQGFRFHDLRHTGQTLAAATGATVKDLMRRLGHASPVASRTRWLPPAGPLTCPREHAELRAARHPRVRQQADLAPSICAASPHYLPERNRRVRLPGGRPGNRPARR